jgi:hypothetical protein
MTHISILGILVLGAVLVFGLFVAGAVIIAIMLSRKANKDRRNGS